MPSRLIRSASNYPRQNKVFAQALVGGAGAFLFVSAMLLGITLAANPAANLDQCANYNGTTASPATNCSAADLPLGSNNWVNGNLGASKARYFEGNSVPYRMRLSNLVTGATVHHLIIEWDTTKGGKHSFDYLTDYDRTVSGANPCLGVVPACGAAQPYVAANAIPTDLQVTGAGVPQIAGHFKIYGGLITSVSPITYPNGAGFAGDKSARLTINFTASQANPVIAWGGHIATRANWGASNSAVAISGSPYHMRLIDLDGAGGNQDRSLSADAVIFPATITIIKDAVPDDAQDFAYAADGGLSPATFTLDDDANVTNSNTQLFNIATDFKAYHVTETTVSGWTLSFANPPCTVTSPNGGSSSGNAGTGVLTVNLKEGENYTCTFTNTRQGATLTVIKHVINDNGGDAVASDWTMDITGGGTLSTNNFAGAESPGTAVTVTPNTAYSVGESGGPSGYTGDGGDAGCSSLTGIAPGGSATCTITNDDQAASLTVIKHVVNDNGGDAVAADWTMDITGGNPDSNNFAGEESPGTTVSIDANAPYSVAESGGVSGYDGDGGDAGCVSLTGLAPGGSATCTITNDDQAASLTVIKHVVNDNGDDAVASEWTMDITGGNPSSNNFAGAESPGTTVTIDANTAYSVDESGGPAGYTGDGGDAGCSSLTGIAPGGSATCTITNDDSPADVTYTTDVDAQIRDNVTLTGRGTPSGTVDFFLYSDSKCEETAVGSDLDVALTGGSATSKWFDISASDTYYWQEHYDGDTNNKASTGPCDEAITLTSLFWDPPVTFAALFGLGIPLLLWNLIGRRKPEAV